MKNLTTTIEFLDAVKEKLNLPSDYATAKALEVTRSTVSRYRLGKDHFSDEVAIRVATILEIEAGYVIPCMYAQRAKCTPTKNVWLGMAKQMIAASLMFVFIGVSGAIMPNEAGASELKNNQSEYTLYAIVYTYFRSSALV